MRRDRASEPLAVALEVARLFDAIGVRYVVGGSLASSVHGEPRSTLDVDLVAALLPEHVAPLVAALGDAYYIDADAVAQAIRDEASFNAIQLASTIKLDVFVAGRDAFEAERLARAVEVLVGPDPGDRLDRGVLRRWAPVLGVSDLVERLVPGFSR